ncbi:Zinc finger protein Pegasus [Acipenser ruthenus]|uniref:Zinc finger protein Pegasus n=1 Tax=Acipenser ruthenus TaxID=7906 RepID=A0A444UKX7_ACIRT|nr:Zinc finger protein Pegasus [Acipenser ruthenus]
MGEKKPEPLDFVKDFQEYLTQQTQHVNMISGSVSGEKETEALQGAGTENDQNGLDHPSVEVSLEDSSGMLVDGFERTYDGKLKCRYCNYASKGTARLIEHIRIHTGKERSLTAATSAPLPRLMSATWRHTCARTRERNRTSVNCARSAAVTAATCLGTRPTLANKKMLSILQKKSSNLGFSRRLLINFSPPSMVVQRPDYLNDFSHELPNIHTEAYESIARSQVSSGSGSGCLSRDPQDLMVDNPLNQLSTLAGQLSSLPPESRTPVSPDVVCRDEKPFLIQHPSDTPVVSTVSTSVARSPSPTSPEPRPPPHPHRNYSPVAGPSSEHSAHTSTPSNSQPSTPAPALPVQDPQLLHHCQNCDTYFADNILYTIHMGCHGYENPFQCNICGYQCKNKYNFACHFARGQHKQQ